MNTATAFPKPLTDGRRQLQSSRERWMCVLRNVACGALMSLGVVGMVLGAGDAVDLPVDDLSLPPGFAIELYASDVPDARQMALAGDGVLFVGSRREGKVHAVIDEDGDHQADSVVLMAEDLFMPSGLAFREGSLYVAEVNRVVRYDDIVKRAQRGKKAGKPVVVTDDLPSDRHHGWKYLRFGPSGKMYVPVGVNCNICDPEDPYATILRMNPDGSQREVFARGVRNTVGFDWRPGTNELWFSDNGRDLMADDVPADELNRTTESGQHFGYPYCHAGTVLDPEFGEGKDCGDYEAPAMPLGPHVAALGLRFYRGEMFPAAYRNKVFITEHGSWNRTQKIGYRVMMVSVDEEGNASDYEEFVTGWLDGQKAWGRPSDLIEMPDGSLLVADDQANAIYRISYSADNAPR